MENKQLRFRTATVGGFNKQDVINYLEQSAQAHAGEVAQLQRALAEEQALREEYEKQVAADQAALAEADERATQLAGDLAGKDEALVLAQRRAETLEAQLTALQMKLEKLGPAAEAYAGLKDRAAGIELEAYNHAKAIEEEGRARVQKAQRKLLASLEEMQRTYAKMKSNMELTLTLAARELRRAGKEVEGLAGDVVDSEVALRTLREQIGDIVASGPEFRRAGGDDLRPLPVDEPPAPTASRGKAPQGPVPFTREGEEW